MAYESNYDQSMVITKKSKKTKHSSCSPSFTTKVEKMTSEEKQKKNLPKTRKSNYILDMFRGEKNI